MPNSPKISKVLIANNGMSAIKAIRSIRKWAYEQYGQADIVKFTAMCTPEDLKVNAEFVRMADSYVEVPGGGGWCNYGNVDLIVDIAERLKVHAVWVGWGFASENPVLAEKLAKLNPPVVFIGPPPSAMRALGDKIASTIVAQSANVPCVPWSGEGLTVDTRDEHGNAYVPDDIFNKATTHDVKEGLTHAARIGFPVMIKASEGGGGKGIRLVDDEATFSQKFQQVQREVPGSPIFIMKVVKDARHLEVQLLGDSDGNAIALFGRDCSVQRRHQKILEEAPITIAPPHILADMEQAAVRLAKMVGYVSAGTVEYLYEPASQKYYFLELNPRLQVEHPTTEMVSGVNIPAAQLQIAMGYTLSQIQDIRVLYGLTPHGASEIDFEFNSPQSHQIQRKPSPKGHVIAARITAENPDAGFKPNSGKVLELNFRSNSNVWGYFSVNSSGGVHEYADSQFGHVFSYGETRQVARKNLVIALRELSIRGDFRTTVEFLIKLLETEIYIENKFTTGWLDTLISKNISSEKPDIALSAICGAVYKGYCHAQSNLLGFKHALSKGQPPNVSLLQLNCVVQFIINDSQFKIPVKILGKESFRLYINNTRVDVDFKKLADGGLLVLLGGEKHLFYAKDDSQGTQLTLDGKTCILEKENDPTVLRSPSPGKLVRYLVEDQSHVNSGDAYAEIEVMKMYMPLVASESGVIHLELNSGSILSTGDVIARLQLDDPLKVKRAVAFDGVIPDFGAPQNVGFKIHQMFNAARKRLILILEGFDSDDDVAILITDFLNFLDDESLPYFELHSILSMVSSRIPPALLEVIMKKIKPLTGEGISPERQSTTYKPFPAMEIMQLIDEHTIPGPNSTQQEISELNVAKETCTPIIEHCMRYLEDGIRGHKYAEILDLIQKYVGVEDLFHDRHYEDVMNDLRSKFDSDFDKMTDIALAHLNARQRSKLMLELLNYVVNIYNSSKKDLLIFLMTKLASYTGRFAAPLALRARELLIDFQSPSSKEFTRKVRTTLASSVSYQFDRVNSNAEVSSSVVRHIDCDITALLKLITTSNYAVMDVLPRFFYSADVGICSAAFCAYILHVYQAYSITYIKPHVLPSTSLMFRWQYAVRPSNHGPTSSNHHSPASSISGLPFPIHRTSSTVSIDQPFASELSSPISGKPHKGIQNGFMTFLSYKGEQKKENFMKHIYDGLMQISDSNSQNSSENEIINPSTSSIFTFVLKSASDTEDSLPDIKFDDVVASYAAILKECRDTLIANKVRRITFIALPRGTKYPMYYTFRDILGFKEDEVLRNIEPASAHQFELHRLRNYEITSSYNNNRRVHVYHGIARKNPSDSRFFARAVILPRPDEDHASVGQDFLLTEGSRILSDILDALAVVSGKHLNSDCNHIFINFLPAFSLNVDDVEEALNDLLSRYSTRAWKLRVTGIEIRVILRSLPSSFRRHHNTGSTSSYAGGSHHGSSTSLNALGNGMLSINTSSSLTNHMLASPTSLSPVGLVSSGLSSTALPLHTLKPFRFVFNAIAEKIYRTEIYQEVLDGSKSVKLTCLTSPPGPYHLQPALIPYETKEPLQPKRYKAHLMGTTYVYDIPELFRWSLQQKWGYLADTTGARIPNVLLNTKELVLHSKISQDIDGKKKKSELEPVDPNNDLIEVVREPGMNSIGMIAWCLELFTPEYPQGRKIVVIANDITFNMGSFGPREDELFFRASRYARQRGLPRIYFSANSGARIGLATEVLNKVRVAWKNEQLPSKGFDYLYLSDEDYRNEMREYVKCEIVHHTRQPKADAPESDIASEVTDSDAQSSNTASKVKSAADLWDSVEIRYKINDIIGRIHGLGVENLRGSGLIAGETSAAYNDIFTLTIATCRSVGIGAYLARLGQRIIQVEYTPILLTGAAALNKLLGREVYTSNLQLGGTQIMYNNGVSHLVAGNDLESVAHTLEWLSFIPHKKNAPLPVIIGMDPVDRPIQVPLDKQTPYDPRELLNGRVDAETGQWQSGFFDNNSFHETLSGWAKGIVVGRARLGGIPVGVISVDTRTTETVIPADPANDSSVETKVPEAGQVWYPNSAFKTAQAINDFNNGEQLPLFIFANWRGFSGGQNDMYKEILKFGSFIVDALREFKQPIFIYIIGELRGGAWVVMDPTINPDHMEMYAETNARGGVLEAEGIVEIKCRKPQLLATIERLHPEYKELKEEYSRSKPLNDNTLETRIKEMENVLLPIYHQVATNFADLHDTPGRMLQKRVIERIVRWKDARRVFYWRLLRKLEENHLIDEIIKIRSVNEAIVKSTSKSPLDLSAFNSLSKLDAENIKPSLISSKSTVTGIYSIQPQDYRGYNAISERKTGPGKSRKESATSTLRTVASGQSNAASAQAIESSGTLDANGVVSGNPYACSPSVTGYQLLSDLNAQQRASFRTLIRSWYEQDLGHVRVRFDSLDGGDIYGDSDSESETNDDGLAMSDIHSDVSFIPSEAFNAETNDLDGKDRANGKSKGETKHGYDDISGIENITSVSMSMYDVRKNNTTSRYNTSKTSYLDDVDFARWLTMRRKGFIDEKLDHIRNTSKTSAIKKVVNMADSTSTAVEGIIQAVSGNPEFIALLKKELSRI